MKDELLELLFDIMNSEGDKVGASNGDNTETIKNVQAVMRTIKLLQVYNKQLEINLETPMWQQRRNKMIEDSQGKLK